MTQNNKKTSALHSEILNEEKNLAPSRVRFGHMECSTHSIYDIIAEINFLLKNPDVTPRNIVCINAHIYNLASKNERLRGDLLGSRIIAADGISIIWALRYILKVPVKERCNMTDAFVSFLKQNDMPPSQAVLVGLSADEAKSAMEKINTLSRHCKVTNAFDGFRSDEEYAQLFENIKKPEFVFVGMGSPRSERIIQIIKDKLPQTIAWHIGGGTLAIFAGTASQAPKFMKNLGLQWLYRFLCEPARLFKRYVIGNPLFVWKVLRDSSKNTK